MNPDQLLAQFKRLTGTLSTQQMAVIAAVFVGVVGILVGTAYYINTPTYVVLMSDMDAESAGDVVKKLKAAKVDYRLDDGGRTVRVPTTKLDELRLDFTSSGAPAGGRIGFEIFDRVAFGTTEFLEQVNYRRALEGELARTIGILSEVESARVHIALPKPVLFTSQSEPAKASVVLKLKGRKPLSPQTVAGITNLLAASIEELRPEAVSIIDNFGRQLTQKGSDDEDNEAGGLHLDKQRQYEKDLTQKVIALLEPVVGEGRVRVNVAARLAAGSSEETQEQYDPETPVLRSTQKSQEVGATPATLPGGGAGGGTAGARSNTPPPADTNTAPVSMVPGAPSQRTTENSNFEISKTVRHTITPSGQVERLSVAVLVDDDRTTEPAKDGTPGKPEVRKPEELEKIQKLVSAAVGFDADRGDQLTVENISFDDNMTIAPEPPKTMLQKVTTVVQSDTAIEASKTLGILLLAVLAFFLFLKPVLNKALGPANTITLPQVAVAAAGGGTVALPGVDPSDPKAAAVAEATAAIAASGGVQGSQPTVGELEEELDDLYRNKEQRRLPALTRHVSKLAEEQPESVARLVRSWMADHE